MAGLTCEIRGQRLLDTNGMSEVWETIYSAYNLDPNADMDGDGQSNYQKSIAGTDPRDPQSVFRITAWPVTSPAYLLRWSSVAGVRYQVLQAGDMLGPWLPKGTPLLGTDHELLAAVPMDPTWTGPAFFSLSVVTDNPAIEWSRPYIGDMDSDGDGVADIDEFAAGTNPLDPASRLALTGAVGRAMMLQWPSVAWKCYQVKTRYSLPGPWTALGGPIQGTGSDVSVAVEVGINAQFFCVQVFDLDSDHDGATDWEQGMAGIAPGFYYGPGAHDTNPPPNASIVAEMLGATNVLCVNPSIAVANASTLCPGSFRLMRSGNLNPLTVHYTVEGTAIPGVDYEPLPTSVAFGPGVNQVEIPVNPLTTEDTTPSKSVCLTLCSNAGYTLGTNSTAEIRVVQEAALSIKDFGAAGDGVTDDTLAVQAAIAALETDTNHNTLFFPAGTYRLNTPSLGSDAMPPNAYFLLLELGRTDLAGRDLFFVGDTNAVLYSTVSWLRARMLVVHASFRSLSFRGLTFRKEPKALPPWGGTLGADGVYMKNQDLRRVESVDFAQCTFDNCHGSAWITGAGYDLRGRLAHFRMARCNLLDLYGSNMTNAAAAYGGGVSVYLDAWVGEALYHDNLFDGGSDHPDPVYNPDAVRMDGSHFGSPLSLLFTNNVVLHMAVEAVMQSDDPFMSTSTSDFTVPPVDARPTNVMVVAYPSTYRPGQILNFRTWPLSGGEAVNIVLAAAAFDKNTSTLSVTNPGITPSVEGMLIPAQMPIYCQDYNPTLAVISGNVVSDPSQIGFTAICPNAKSVVTHNFIRGYGVGIYQYPPDHNPYRPPMSGTLIASNVIVTPNTAARKYGMITCGPGNTILHNLVIKESTNCFCGISLWCSNAWIRANTILSRKVWHEAYDSPLRSVGVAFRSSSQTTSMDNRTYGMDVGIGPELPFEVSPHRVISHFSTQDTLSSDPAGVY